MPETLDSKSILRELRSQILDINHTIRKTRSAITESATMVERADDLLKDGQLMGQARWPR